MNIILFDFEVFKYDTLLGTTILDTEKKTIETVQLWSPEKIKQFFLEHKSYIWVGHNNVSYDNLILEAIVDGLDPYKTSKSVINSRFRPKCRLDFINYDLMKQWYSLKMSELSAGKSISETQVDFDLDRPLTVEELELTESYNKDDLSQTLYNFEQSSSDFILRLNIIKEFNLSFSVLNSTEAKIATLALKAKQIPGIEHMKVKPVVYDTLLVKNHQILDFYLNEDFRKGKNIEVELCGTIHKLGAGGIHAAKKKVFYKKAMYFDVSGYYNLVMLNYDLLPRTVPQEGKELYEYMYKEQLRLKKIDPARRWVYKTILLSVFGAMMNEYTDFYDPERGSLVTMVGQMFIVDLLEKLEGLGEVVQSNTDGIIFNPFDWANEQKIWNIVEAWENRTGFVIKKEHVYNLWQRDVNNYCFSEEEDVMQYRNGTVRERGDRISVKGECVGAYDKPIDLSTQFRLWELKEPKIICQGIVDFLMYGFTPEETVESLKQDLRYFQFSCKKNSFDYLTYEQTNLLTNEKTSTVIQNVNRAFAWKSDTSVGMVFKHKREGKVQKSKISNLPESVFIYNEEILSKQTVDKLQSEIDWQYYIDRIYERIKEFITVPTIRSFNDGQKN